MSDRSARFGGQLALESTRHQFKLRDHTQKLCLSQKQSSLRLGLVVCGVTLGRAWDASELQLSHL